MQSGVPTMILAASPGRGEESQRAMRDIRLGLSIKGQIGSEKEEK